MAMTKAEKAVLDSVVQSLRRERAMRMSEHHRPQPINLLQFPNQAVFGWALRGDRVEEGWTTISVHGWGGPAGYKASLAGRGHAAQGVNRDLYRTEREALIVLRLKKEIEFADALLEIDDKLAAYHD